MAMTTKPVGELVAADALILHSDIGSATLGDRMYRVSANVGGNPMITSQSTGRRWTVGWQRLIELAQAEGIDDEPEVNADTDMAYCALLLVGAPNVPEEAVASWSQDERNAAYDWAMARHIRASDNDVEVPPMPACVAAYLEGGA